MPCLCPAGRPHHHHTTTRATEHPIHLNPKPNVISEFDVLFKRISRACNHLGDEVYDCMCFSSYVLNIWAQKRARKREGKHTVVGARKSRSCVGALKQLGWCCWLVLVLLPFLKEENAPENKEMAPTAPEDNSRPAFLLYKLSFSSCLILSLPPL